MASRVDVNRQIRMRLLELLNGSDRDVLILFAEVENHRNLRLLRREIRDAAAVVRD